jgi:pimeloyl-ACP methyl ester carboxylesterase
MNTSNPVAILIKFATALVLVLACHASSAAGDVAAIVMHGKWGTPDGPVSAVAQALLREGYIVVAPEMPWSRRRLYDRTVEETDTQIDAEIAKLRAGGAKHVFLVGHSLGAAYALHYAGRAEVSGVVVIAPGHRPENARFAEWFRDDVRKARELVAAGTPGEIVSFTDLNTGGRRDRLSASAAAVVSYFDPAGPLNMSRNVSSLKPSAPVLWLVPTREEPGPRQGVFALYKQLPVHAATRLVEPDSDHLNAPAASAPAIIEWLHAVTATKR